MSDDRKVRIRTYRIDVGRTSRTERIDSYLTARFPDYSRTFVQKLIRDGRVRVDGQPVKPSYSPMAGDHIVAEVPTLRSDTIEAENMELKVVYEDRWILVVDKPSDMVVHPSRGHQSGTLAHGAAYHCESLSSTGGALRPGIVHRLDRDTSGVIILVKDESVHEPLAKQFERRTVDKEYVAICRGSVPLDRDMIDAPIGRHERRRERMTVRYDTGKPATTAYEVRRRFGDMTLVHCFPHSGRTHQIRVHLQHIGHPIVCDPLYGNGGAIYPGDLSGEDHGPLEEPVIARQALHARRIAIVHPALGQTMQFEAPLPRDMRELIERLEARGVHGTP